MDELVWLKHTLSSCYGLEVHSATRVRDAWRLDTTSGPKCFKRVKSSVGKVEFTAAALEHVIRNGFTQTIPLMKTMQNNYAANLPEGVFYATDWLAGREGDFSKLDDIQSAALALGRFHKASLGFVPPPHCESKETWGKIPGEWQKRGLELVEFQELARRHPEELFNNLYLSCVTQYLNRVQTAHEILSGCDYSGLVQSAKEQGSLCHRDYTYHNFLVDDQGTLFIIDFDYCTQEIRAYDVGRFIRKVAKHHKYKLSPVKLLLSGYQTETQLNSDELVFILAFVHFPQRFWRLAKRYFSGGAKYSREHLTMQLENEINDFRLEADFLLQLATEISRGVLLRR